MGYGTGHGDVQAAGFSCPFGLLDGEGMGYFDECTKDLFENEGKDSRIFFFLLDYQLGLLPRHLSFLGLSFPICKIVTITPTLPG